MDTPCEYKKGIGQALMFSGSSNIPLQSLLIVFATLLVFGIELTIPLFKFNYRRFFKSALFIKIVLWVPIFGVFLALLYGTNAFREAVLGVLLLASLAEIINTGRRSRHKLLLGVYYVLFSIALGHFYFLKTTYSSTFINLLITICFATVLADVTAFFFGNYLGKHKLPAWLNKNKSWEGVAGQILGAFFGVLIVNTFITPVLSIWIFLPIGLGSAVGDLVNSYVKRKLEIKDWSNSIPGHGGFIDRLSSIAGSAVITFYFLKITGL